jgi:predicted Zn-dependent peptidase
MSELPEYNGLSHLYEHMFFKGNKAISDQSRKGTQPGAANAAAPTPSS